MGTLNVSQNGPTKFKLECSGDRRDSVVEIAAKYVPVDIKLEPRESINSTFQFISRFTFSLMYLFTDQGVLRVELISAVNLHAADRGGKLLTRCLFCNALRSYDRQIGHIRRVFAEWRESFQIPDEEEDLGTGVE